MRYYKISDDIKIIAVGVGTLGDEISEEEYIEIIHKINDKPKCESGYGCRMNIENEFELYKFPEIREEITDSEALEIITGGRIV